MGLIAKAAGLAVLMAAFLAGACSDTRDPPDLVAYLERTREAGMSEGAASAVGMIASVRTGQIKLSYSKDDDSGRYWTSYSNTTCAKPNVDAAKAEGWRESQKREIEQELMALRSAADSDQSGFVSTEEGSEFRRIVEFGFLAAYIAQAGNADLAAIATGTGLDMDTTREQIRKYRDFDRALVAAGSPRLPEIIGE